MKFMNVCEMPLLSQGRDDLCKSYFNKLRNLEYKLNELISKKRMDLRTYDLRNDQHFSFINRKTTGFRIFFISSSMPVYNDSIKL